MPEKKETSPNVTDVAKQIARDEDMDHIEVKKVLRCLVHLYWQDDDFRIAFFNYQEYVRQKLGVSIG